MNKKPKKKKKRLTANELKALELVAKHPEKSNYAIGRDMVGLGMVRDEGYLTKRVNKSEVIKARTSILQEKGQLQITRLVPKAVKKLKTSLEGDKTPLKVIDMTLKHGLSKPEDTIVRQPMVHVDTLNIVQGNQLVRCQDALDAIEVEESSNDNE